MTLEVEGKEPEVIRCPVDINGFEYETGRNSPPPKQGRRSTPPHPSRAPPPPPSHTPPPHAREGWGGGEGEAAQKALRGATMVYRKRHFAVIYK